MSEEGTKENIPPAAKLLAVLEREVNQHAATLNMTIVEIIGVIELLKHQLLSEARDTYKQHVQAEEVRKEVNYFG